MIGLNPDPDLPLVLVVTITGSLQERAMLETCGSTGKSVSREEGVPSR